jgi:hypothetical protein
MHGIFNGDATEKQKFCATGIIPAGKIREALTDIQTVLVETVSKKLLPTTPFKNTDKKNPIETYLPATTKTRRL